MRNAHPTTAVFIKNFAILAQDKYGAIFNELMPVLSDVAAKLGAYPIELVNVDDNIAQYSIASDEIIDGQPRTATYFIYFIKDMDGLWKIDKY